MYDIYKDSVVLILAIPAAWLGYCFQRRLSWLQQIRDLWARTVESVQAAIAYTYLSNPSEARTEELLEQLSTMIDEIRGSFRNVRGLYPYESFKQIHEIVVTVKEGKMDAAVARAEIVRCWKQGREHLLAEFERDYPMYPDTPYLSRTRTPPKA